MGKPIWSADGAVDVAIGEAVRRARTAKGLRQADLWPAVKVSESTWKKIEQGTRSATADELVRIAGALGITINELIEGAEVINFEALHPPVSPVPSTNGKQRRRRPRLRTSWLKRR